MGLLSNTGLIPSCPKNKEERQVIQAPPPDLKGSVIVTQAPYMLRPYAGLYNPFATRCSVLCNHPTDVEAKDFLRRAKDAWQQVDKNADDNDYDKSKMPHDIVTEDMFRRYAETDSRPLTPAPTLASGKSRGSRRCLTPDQPHPRTTIVLDLRRSHSQETLYYHGYSTSEMTAGNTTNDRSTLPSVSLSEATHSRLAKGDCEHLPPLASPLVLCKRTERPPKEPSSVRGKKHVHWLETKLKWFSGKTLLPIQEHPNPKATKFLHNILPKKYHASILKNNTESQVKALNLNKGNKGKSKGSGDTPAASQRSKPDENETEIVDETVLDLNNDDAASIERRRGKRRRKGRQSDRLTSAGLAGQTQQDPETQIAGIGTDSHNPSSRGSIAAVSERGSGDADDYLPPAPKPQPPRFMDSFLDSDILRFLHREVDEDAIESEFDTKRRYVLEEAFRTRPERSLSQEVHNHLKDIKVAAVSLGDWLHIPRIFSRQTARFSLPLDTRELEGLSPMQYAARYVTIKKSKQLLYLTVLRKFRPEGYRMPIKDIDEGLILMMGGMITDEQVKQFRTIMEWDHYEDDENPADIKITMQKSGMKKLSTYSVDHSNDKECIRYRTWCGLCAICERMYGRYPPRNKDPPDGMELGDFSMVETKLTMFKVHSGLAEILHVIRTR